MGIRKLKLIRKFFDFNPYERDRWVEKQAAIIPSGSSVLDVGAGSCPYRACFSHCEYKAHDFASLKPEQISGKAGYGNIDHISDILSIPVEDNSFDVILCTEVLEHVPEPIRVLEEFARIIKPSGKLLITAPLGSGIHQEPYHYYGGFTPFWYQEFLQKAGFDQVVIEANGGFFKHFGQESIRFLQKTAPWKVALGLTGRIAWSIVWLVLLPLFLAFPLLCHFLDPLDSDQGFTVGYHVVACVAVDNR